MSATIINDISYCGLDCHGCPIYWATVEDDPVKKEKIRKAVVEIAKKQYDIDFSIEDITDCDGCKGKNGRLFSGCHSCQIRMCAQEKNLENCAYCPDYPCENLEDFLAKDPTARTHLDVIRTVL